MFVTIETKYLNRAGDFETRSVTLDYSKRDNDITLLGNIPHGNKIVVNQELVNALQELVNLQNKNA